MLGKGGAHIAQIRSMSGARVLLQGVRGAAAGAGRASIVLLACLPGLKCCTIGRILYMHVPPPPPRPPLCPRLQDLEGGGRSLMVAGQPEHCHAAHSMANAFLSEWSALA